MNAVASRNIKFVGHSDMDGRADGVQVMVNRGYAYVGHGFSNGITTLDVRDPKHPKVVDFIACAPGTRALHLQTHDDLLLCGQRAERLEHAGISDRQSLFRRVVGGDDEKQGSPIHPGHARLRYFKARKAR